MIHPDEVTVVIPSIPPRSEMLLRAIRSVQAQTHPASAISVAVDTCRLGAAHTRQRALMKANTPWVAFLDDDDEFLPDHLQKLVEFALETGADYVYSWFKVVSGGVVLEHDPVFPPTHFTEPWNPADPRQTTITTLVRTELAQEVGFLPPPIDGKTPDGNIHGEDWSFTLECNRRGRIEHLAEKTWLWHHDSLNTSGRPDRW
jgi:hypothetical protein